MHCSELKENHINLGHFDEVSDDCSSLLSCRLTQNHDLDPLRNAVKEGNETLQNGIIHRAAVHHKTVVVLELKPIGHSQCESRSHDHVINVLRGLKDSQ